MKTLRCTIVHYKVAVCCRNYLLKMFINDEYHFLYLANVIITVRVVIVVVVVVVTVVLVVVFTVILVVVVLRRGRGLLEAGGQQQQRRRDRDQHGAGWGRRGTEGRGSGDSCFQF